MPICFRGNWIFETFILQNNGHKPCSCVSGASKGRIWTEWPSSMSISQNALLFCIYLWAVACTCYFSLSVRVFDWKCFNPVVNLMSVGFCVFVLLSFFKHHPFTGAALRSTKVARHTWCLSLQLHLHICINLYFDQDFVVLLIYSKYLSF